MIRVTDDHPGLLPQSQWWHKSHLCNKSSCCALGIDLNRLKGKNQRGDKCKRLTMYQMEQFLPHLPHLKHFHFVFQAYATAEICDGYRWQLLTSSLITFNFKFHASLVLSEQTLDSFRSTFWLEEKRWFVAYQEHYLFSIPYFAPSDAAIPYKSSVYFTAPDNSVIYDHVTKVVVTKVPIQISVRFSYIKVLELRCSISLETLLSIVNLSKVEHLTVSSYEYISLMAFIRAMPSLHSLSIEHCSKFNLIEEMQGNQIEQIRILQISYYPDRTDHFIEQMCRCFPSVEHLIVPCIVSRSAMIRCIDGFKKLSSASFSIYDLSKKNVQKYNNNPDSIISESRRLIHGAYTLRYNHMFEATSTVYLWLGQQVNDTHLITIVIIYRAPFVTF
ncbi:unnamed protein product [Rotaria sp. Silwood1]|nr:unnamed protein product [Rotaria sp. Silwood1]